MIAHLAGGGGKRFQVGEEVADVFKPRMLIGRVGKGRKVMRPLRRGPFGHGADELGFGPSPDAIGRIGRNVRRVKCPEWRWNGEAAAKPQAMGLAGRGVARRTAAGIEGRK